MHTFLHLSWNKNQNILEINCESVVMNSLPLRDI